MVGSSKVTWLTLPVTVVLMTTCISLPHCSKLLFTHRWGGHMYILLTESGKPPVGWETKGHRNDPQLQECHLFHCAELSVYKCAYYNFFITINGLLMLYKHVRLVSLHGSTKVTDRLNKGGLNLRRSSRQRAWLGHGSLSKTIRPGSLFPASAPAARVTEALRESEAWGENPQQYCTLCVAASSP